MFISTVIFFLFSYLHNLSSPCRELQVLNSTRLFHGRSQVGHSQKNLAMRYTCITWCRTCNLVVPSLSPPPCHSLALFSVAPSSTQWLCCVNDQLVCLLPVEIFKHSMFVSVIVKYYRLAIALYINSVLLLILRSSLIIPSISIAICCFVTVFNEN